MTLLRRAATAAAHVRASVPQSSAGDPWAIPSNGSLPMSSAAGVPMSEDTAMRIAVVYGCVRIISNALAGLPFDAVRMKGTFREQLDPAPTIIADPFGGAAKLSGITRRAGLATMAVSCLLWGNAYALVVARDGRGYPTRLQIQHPGTVRVKTDDNGQRAYRINNKDVPAADVLHVTGMSMPGAPEGIGVIAYLAQAMGLALAAETYGAKFFANGAHMSGVIEVEDAMDRTKARQLKEAFLASNSGMKNAHTVGVLGFGAKFNPISIPPDQAQFLGTRAAQNLDLAMAFGVPPHMLGQVDRTTSWGKGIEEQKLGFLNFTLSDWTGRFEDAWSAMLPKPQVARFNLDAFLRADTTTRYTAYMQARNAAIMTPNEIRALENMAPIDGGEDLFAPLNSAHTVSTLTTQDDDALDDEGKTPPADPAAATTEGDPQ